MKKLKKSITVAMILTFVFSLSTFGSSAADSYESVYVGGESFGVRFFSDGVMVVDLESYYDGQKYVCPASDGGLKVNDIIKKANGDKISSNEKLKETIEGCGGNKIKFEIERDGKTQTKEIEPVKNTVGVYLIGAWVRDSCAGIGTVTYYDDDNNYFAALGHGICDNDTSALLPLGSAETVQAEISGTVKSVCGKAGSLNGYFTDLPLGTLSLNSSMGIFGSIETNVYKDNKRYIIAESDEIKPGKVTLITTIEGSEPEEYEAEIKRICNRSEKSNENFVIKITDEEIIEKCGGIVQGMSGSPIIQNGMLVGAVTHVFVNNPTQGYGVFAQYMAAYYKNQQ